MSPENRGSSDDPGSSTEPTGQEGGEPGPEQSARHRGRRRGGGGGGGGGASVPASASYPPGGQTAPGPTPSAAPATLEELYRLLLLGGGRLPVLPISLRSAPFPSEEGRALMAQLNDRLTGRAQIPVPRADPIDRCMTPINVAFPPCSDVLLALVRAAETDELTTYFNDYFQFCDHAVVADRRHFQALDPDLVSCTSKWYDGLPDSPCAGQGPEILAPAPRASSGAARPCAPFPAAQWPPLWPPPWCLPPSCVTLAGTRHLYDDAATPPDGFIRRLTIADVAWLFWHEQMGIFKILGVLLDDYARVGRIPLSNRNGVVPLVLEAMTRMTQMGASSRAADRATLYRRVLGWNTDVGRKLNLDTSVNVAFNRTVHTFLQHAAEFNGKKQLAVAIQATAVPGRPSVATLVTISDTLDLLKKAFDPFDYGRNYHNALAGIVWAVAAMALIREVRTTLGIPPEYEQPYEFIPAAYDLLVLKRPVTPAEANRYSLHRELALSARDILLDVEVLNHLDNGAGGELETWLDVIEPRVESYRTAYRTLTGVDLGSPAAGGLPPIVQQA